MKRCQTCGKVQEESSYERYSRLGQIYDYDQIIEKSKNMVLGNLLGMLDWCKGQGHGVVAPWRLRRIGFGKFRIPIPALSGMVILMIIAAVISGAATKSAVLVGGILILALFTIGFSAAEYIYEGRGTCHICGSTDLKDGFDGIRYMDGKGREKIHSQAGLCSVCALTITRYKMWKRATTLRLHSIRSNKVSGFIFGVVYGDPYFPDNKYTRRELKYPKDVLPWQVIAQVQESLMANNDLLERTKETMRYR